MRKVESKVNSKFSQMYYKEASKDITFVVQNSLVKAHSFVIESMCESFYDQIAPLKESYIELEGITVEVFSAFIKYLYFNEFEEREEIAVGLLKLSVKYELPKLATECEKCINKLINEHNAIQYLIKPTH